jgi:hypothetical protein
MSLQIGDWVRTENGEVGRVVHIDRLTAFVGFKGDWNDQGIKPYLVSSLTKIDPPEPENKPPSAK